MWDVSTLYIRLRLSGCLYNYHYAKFAYHLCTPYADMDCISNALMSLARNMQQISSHIRSNYDRCFVAMQLGVVSN